MEKRKWLKIFLFSFVIFIIIIALLIHYKRYWIVAFSDVNTVPMYKFNSYEDYKKNRPAYLAEANDNFVNDILNPNQDFDDGVIDKVAFASNHLVNEGFAYMPKDYATGMKRLNQAWLIAPDNYNVYWGFAVWERNYAGDCDAARNFLEKATEYYNERYKIKDGDRDRLEKDKTSLLSGCANQQTPSQPYVIQNTKVNIAGNYLGSDYKGNYVWGGAMNLAWNELNENILHEKLKFKTADKIALEMAEKLNNPIFIKNDLDDKSYYIKSGYGQTTVDTINEESKKKFPSKSFGDLKMDLSPTDIISYAYFLKEVEYKTVFEKKDVSFNGQKVKGFYAKEKDQRNNVKIIKYENDDKFIVSLQLKDESDRLILAKGYDMTNPQNVVNEINQNNKGYLATIGGSDRFEAPKLHLDHHRDYIELLKKYLANKGFEEYFIAQMFENIKFDMDEKGARVENEAVIGMKQNAIMEPEKPKNLILDKPYWVVMQRKNSQNPYFILGVNNTELMEKN